jgi:hypothetical protein
LDQAETRAHYPPPQTGHLGRHQQNRVTRDSNSQIPMQNWRPAPDLHQTRPGYLSNHNLQANPHLQGGEYSTQPQGWQYCPSVLTGASDVANLRWQQKMIDAMSLPI